DKVDSFSAEATAGVSGIDTGIAGALAVNVGMSHSKAAIANSATVTITDGGDVALTAENFVANSTKASGKQEAGGKTGVGAAIGARAKASAASAADEDQNNKSTDQGGSGGKSVDQKVTGQKDTASNKATTADSGAAGKTGDTSNASASTSSGDSSSGSSVSVA